MTSNAEEQANGSGRHTATAQNHQTRQRCATEAPCCARQAKVGKEGQLGRTAAQKPKGRQTGQTRRRYPRGEQDSKSPGLAEAAELRFIERTYESHGLVGAFCPWIPQRLGEQADEAQARVREERERGAPLHRPRLKPAQNHLAKEPLGHRLRRLFSARFRSDEKTGSRQEARFRPESNPLNTAAGYPGRVVGRSQ